jgi:hypothetical protein
MMTIRSCSAAGLLVLVMVTAGSAATLTGEIRDAESAELLPARIYIQSADGKCFFARSADKAGSAVTYQKTRGEKSVENHTALSAHPFEAELPPGKYTITVEHGKEYLTAEQTVEVGEGPLKVEIKLKRWIDMAAKGWYSGDTHVHRTLADLPTAMLADDLNVALPLTSWVTKSDTPPGQSDRNQPAEAKLVEVSPKHVYWPLNTEYEIFTVGGKQHTLGAVFALNQKQPLTRGVPLVQPIAEEVHKQGGLLDLDKHNWPWSMMLVPVMKVDLFELANNHHWRTEFGFPGWGEPIPRYMGLPTDPQAMEEKHWTDFGFQNYYALLNCGFRLMPTAGTASGVHPVPLGWNRVYVNCPNGFSYGAWMDGLKAGRTFVSQGPMLWVQVNEKDLGTHFKQDEGAGRVDYTIDYEIWNTGLPVRYEIVRGGEVVVSKVNEIRSPEILTQPKVSGLAVFHVDSSTWFAVRCFEIQPDGRERFAHSAPVFIDVPGKPLRPKKQEVDYLISRVKGEIERNTGVLSNEALAEYLTALAAYEEIAKTAK